MIVAIVMALGTLLLMRFVPDVAPTGAKLGRAVRLGYSDIRQLVVPAGGYHDVLVFLARGCCSSTG